MAKERLSGFVWLFFFVSVKMEVGVRVCWCVCLKASVSSCLLLH